MWFWHTLFSNKHTLKKKKKLLSCRHGNGKLPCFKRQIICKWRIVHCDGRLPTRLRSQEGDFKRVLFYSNHMQRRCHVIFLFFGWLATTGNDSMQPLTTGWVLSLSLRGSSQFCHCLSPMPNRIVLQLGINITDGYKLVWNMSIRNNWQA